MQSTERQIESSFDIHILYWNEPKTSVQLSFEKGSWAKGKALIAALWVSLAGPLSWFFIFKGHAYIHPHMDHIVWHFPFMLFAFVLMGVFMKQCIATFLQEKKQMSILGK